MPAIKKQKNQNNEDSQKILKEQQTKTTATTVAEDKILSSSIIVNNNSDHSDNNDTVIKKESSLSLKTRLNEQRKLRTNARSENELKDILIELKQIIADAHEELNDEIWNYAGLFLATLLLQQQEDDVTVSNLLYERGFLYRLSKDALTLCHDNCFIENPILLPKNNYSKNNKIAAMAWDSVLPPDLLRSMQHAFDPKFNTTTGTKNNFWSAHDYSDGSAGTDPSPYFSYVLPITDNNTNNKHNDENTSTTVLERVIEILRQLVSQAYPQVLTKDCTAVEWWCHNRPPSSGHQLHFDSDDEGRGGVRNPICSTVLYLSSCKDGGETLITTQSSTSTKLTEHNKSGWICSSKENRLLTFAGNLLHGVIPGRPGVPSSSQQQQQQLELSNNSNDCNNSSRRVTFMCAFWKKIHLQDDKLHHGAARSFFGRVDGQEWAKPLLLLDNNQQNPKSSSVIINAKHGGCFYQIPTVWEDIDEKRNHQYKESLAHARKYGYLPPYDAFFQFYG